MKKQMVLLMSLVMMWVCSGALLAQSKEDVTGHKLYTAQADGGGDDLGITFRNMFTTKYIWHGYDLFDDRTAWMPELDFDLFGTGFGVNIWMAQPIGSGAEEASELDYTLYYTNTVYEGDTGEMEYTAFYRYYDFVKLNKHADNQEVGVEMAFPNLLEEVVPGLVPSYTVSQIWFVDANSSSTGGGQAGAFHVLALDYPLELPADCPMADALNMHTLNLHTDLNYNDGYAGSDNDWSHMTFGVSSNVEIAGMAFEPFLNFQLSMDDSVNPDDEFWGGVTTSISF